MITADDSVATLVSGYHAVGPASQQNGARESAVGEKEDAREASKKTTSLNGSVSSGLQRFQQVEGFTLNSSHSLPPVLLELFSESVTAKMIRAATEGLRNNVSRLLPLLQMPFYL